MKRVAAIDIGTNSVLLLIADVSGGAAVPLVERATITRLGQGVDRSRRLAPEAIERTLACLERYAAEIREHAPDVVLAVGTSAMRDAEGGASFRERARDLLGVEPRVASGDEEAELTFLGALSGLQVAGDVLVVDVGGGSTEIITGDVASGPRDKISLDIGSVRLTERHVRDDPPSEADLERVRADVRAALEGVPFRPSGLAVGVAGTVTTIAAFAKDIVPYDGARAHGAVLTRDEVSAAVAELARLPVEQRRQLPAVDPKRADVIVAGAVLVDELLRFHGIESMIVSDRGVRWGLVARATSGNVSPAPPGAPALP
jgi:exopolyphosphatase / guanosine-5'-triphosphate,3'-diphosphate pyrophosphatase